MATMNISLTDELKAFVEERVRSGEYSNASEFVRDLIRRNRERRSYQLWLQNEIEAGIASGVSEFSLEDILAEAREKSTKAGHGD